RGAFTAVRAGASGKLSLEEPRSAESPIAWTKDLTASPVASPLLYQGRVYLLENQSGIVRCLNAATGDELYRKRLPEASGFTASPIAAKDRIYFLDQNGQTTVIDP